jgi:hypothetical protein
MSIAAIATAIAALWGLNTWRRELHGRVEFDLARKILTSLNRVRTAVSRIRWGGVLKSEMPASILREGEIETDLSTEEKHRRVMRGVFSKRTQPLSEEWNNLWALTEEADALWQGNIRHAVSDLRMQLNTLSLNIERMFSDEPGYDEGDDRTRVRRIVYARFDEDKDDYLKELESRIESVASIVRPHLRKR